MPVAEPKIKKQINKSQLVNETKAQRFKRLAENRTNAILEKIRVLGNCADKRTYEYAEEEVELIFSTIEKELKKVKTKFLIESSPSRKFGFPGK